MLRIAEFLRMPRAQRLATFAIIMVGVLALGTPASAAVNITTPSEGAVFVAPVCPSPDCSYSSVVTAVIDTPGPVVQVCLSIVHTGPDSVTRTSGYCPCSPDDPVEPGDFSCPTSASFIINGSAAFDEGQSTITVTAYGAVVESDSVSVSVTRAVTEVPGPVVLSEVSPNAGVVPRVQVRSNPDEFTTNDPGLVKIYGENLHNNPFLDVYLVPVGPQDIDLSPLSGLPLADWCLYEAAIESRGEDDGRSFIEVRMPELPQPTRWECEPGSTTTGDIFNLRWRWVVRDRWIRPERIHNEEAIPTPRLPFNQRGPYFKVSRPPFPEIYGFGFDNKEYSSNYREFSTVFGDNAYICIGALGACVTHVPDPLYLAIWWPFYAAWIDSSGGSCNGMAATSLQFARRTLDASTYDPDAVYPYGLTSWYPPAGVPHYDDGPCSNGCGPATPVSHRAKIRQNHGIQATDEYINAVFDGLWDGDPGSEGILRGSPNSVLSLLKSGGLGRHVMCLTQISGGHCVTPYLVDDNKIFVYDNNDPGEEDLFIEVDGDSNTYYYPHRDGSPPFDGKGLFLIPLEVFENERTMPGIEDGGEFLLIMVMGDAEASVSTPDGGRFGYLPDGSFVDTMQGGAALPPLGPPDTPVRTVQVALPTSLGAPSIEVRPSDGSYLFHAAQGGHVLQLQAPNASTGNQDAVQLGYASGQLSYFEYSAQHAGARLIPKAGLAMSPDERAVFTWLGLTSEANAAMRIGADKAERSVSYRNGGSLRTQHVLSLEMVDGEASMFGHVMYGPFETPAGASRRIVTDTWPDVQQALSEVDLNNDGIPERTEHVVGVVVPTPTNLNASADLSVSKTASAASITVGESISYTLSIANLGPDTASEVRVIDMPAPGLVLLATTSTQGACAATPTGVICELGELPAGAVAVAELHMQATLPGAATNSAFVVGVEFDPEQANNSALVTPVALAQIDIRPDSPLNTINPRDRGDVPVAILGGIGFDVASIDVASLRFGVSQTAPSHRKCGHRQDVNGDGVADLLLHFRVRDSGIVAGQSSACLLGERTNGAAFSGCDSIATVPR